MTETEVRVAMPDAELANELTAWLQGNGARRVSVVHSKNIDAATLPSIVTAVLLGAAGLSAIFIWLRRQISCTMIVDARNDQLSITYDCRDRRGRTIIVCNGDTRVELVDPGYLLDPGELAKLAVTKGAEAVSVIAQDAKVEFSIEHTVGKNDA